MTRMLWILSIAALLSTSLGCQTLDSWDLFSPTTDKTAPIGKPTEVGAIWQDGVDVQLDRNNGGLPIPGFAGRVFFMQAIPGKPGQGQTVLVDGSLLVMLYDDRPMQNGQPTQLETWTIKPEHLPMLIKKDLTGWGYSLWLPWHTYRPDIKNVRLVVQYLPKDGSQPLLGDPSPLRIRDAHPAGMERPQLSVEKAAKKTWQ